MYSNTYPKEVEQHFFSIDYFLREKTLGIHLTFLPLNADLPHSLSLATDLGIL